MGKSYLVGPFHLDAEAEMLFRNGAPVALSRRAVALLRALVERPGLPVFKDALMDAGWPGLTIEESNLTVQVAALRRVLAAEPGGDRWIETLPRRGYRFVGPVGAVAEDIVKNPAAGNVPALLALPEQPSLAVLAFQNMSGDAEQEYFADGMVEEIITALSRFRSLFVIARNSSFTYKGRSVDVRQVGRELGVRYVVEGSVRRASQRIRITAQLVSASNGAHLWADRFDGSQEDIFDLQDRVAGSVAGEIEPRLNRVALEQARRKPTGSFTAYDCYLRATANCFPATREECDEALRLACKAIDLDGGFALAYGMAAWCYGRRKTGHWMVDVAQETGEAVRLARRAAELGPEDALAVTWAAYALAFVAEETGEGAALLDRALELNPNLATAWGVSGWVRVRLGEPDIAIHHLARAMRLSPLDPMTRGFEVATADACFLSGRYDEALSWVARTLRHDRQWFTPWRIAAATHALAGDMPKAQAACAQLRQLDPLLRISNLRATCGPPAGLTGPMTWQSTRKACALRVYLLNRRDSGLRAIGGPDQPISSEMPASLLTLVQIAAKSPTNFAYSAGVIGLSSGSNTTSLNRSCTSVAW